MKPAVNSFCAGAAEALALGAGAVADASGAVLEQAPKTAAARAIRTRRMLSVERSVEARFVRRTVSLCMDPHVAPRGFRGRCGRMTENHEASRRHARPAFRGCHAWSRRGRQRD